MSTASKVAREKEDHPERFCSARGCLWRVRSIHHSVISPCRKHGEGYVPVITVRDTAQKGRS